MPLPSKNARRRVVYLGLFLAYACLMLFGGCADKFILFPSTERLSAYTARRELVPLADSRAVECWVDRPRMLRQSGAEPVAYVIEFTGNATRAEQVASYVAERWGGPSGHRAVECWSVNYPGYGGSTGPAELAAVPPAALAVYDHVAKLANGKPIFLAGNSLGTTAALYAASQRPCAGFVAGNPPALKNLILTRFGWWNLWLLAGPISMQIPRDLDGPTTAARCNAPAVFLLAADDELVVPKNQRLVYDAYAGPKRLLNLAGGHNDGITGDAEAALQREIDSLWRAATPGSF